MKKNLKIIFNILALLVPVGLIIYFITSENGLIDLIESASKFNWLWLVIGVICQLLNVGIDAFILYKFTNNYDNSYTYTKGLKCTAVGQFFSIITPGAVGGQPMQLYCFSKQKVSTGIASSVLIQKFLVYQSTITVYSFISAILNFNIFFSGMGGLMITLATFGFISHVAVIGVMYMFSFNRKLTSKLIKWVFNLLVKIKLIKDPEEKIKKTEAQLEHFHECNKSLYKNKKLFFQTILLTIIQLTLIFFIPYTIYRGFNFWGANAFDMVTGQSFVVMVSSFMPLPGGSGAAEGCFYVFFDTFFTQNTIKSAILIWRIITYFLNIVVFAPFIRFPKEIKNNK